jgi:hypothetical protein
MGVSMKSTEPKQVLAIEYNGSLYPDLAAAETSRARQKLHELLPPVRQMNMGQHWLEMERSETIDLLLKESREVVAVFARVVAAMGDKR